MADVWIAVFEIRTARRCMLVTPQGLCRCMSLAGIAGWHDVEPHYTSILLRCLEQERSQ